MIAPPFYAQGFSRLTRVDFSTGFSGLGNGNMAMGAYGYIEDFPYSITTDSDFGPIQEHNFDRDFTVTWDDGVNPPTVNNFSKMPLRKSLAGLGGVAYTPIAHTNHRHRFINSSGFINNLRSSFDRAMRSLPGLLFRIDSSDPSALITPIFGVGVLCDGTETPGQIVDQYYVHAPGYDFVPQSVSDPFSFLQSTSGFVLTSPTVGTLTVTF